MADTCFVIQPFDAGKYDQRFKQIYQPAIEQAGFKPYRVDMDPSASIPIEQIERGIEEAAVVFAEITEDNPNVWFEVGFAIARKKDLCMVCSTGRTKFPFDVQHRLIIRYANDAPSDFSELQQKVTERLAALARQRATLDRLPAEVLSSSKAPDSLSDIELNGIAILAGFSNIGEYGPSVHEFRRLMTRRGYTDIAANAAVRLLQRRGLVDWQEVHEFNGDPYKAVEVTASGWTWIDANLSKFVLKRTPVPSSDLDEDLPF